MDRLTSLGNYALIGAAVAALLNTMDLQELARLPRELGHLRQYHQEWSAAVEERQELEEQQRKLVSRINAKYGIIDDLCKGRLTLSEAAGRFRETNDASDEGRRLLTGVGRAESEDEMLYRHVIAWVEHSDAVPEPAGKQLVARLEAELADMLCR